MTPYVFFTVDLPVRCPLPGWSDLIGLPFVLPLEIKTALEKQPVGMEGALVNRCYSLPGAGPRCVRPTTVTVAVELETDA